VVLAVMIGALASSGAVAREAWVHAVAGQGYIAAITRTAQGTQLTHAYLSIETSTATERLGSAVYRPRVGATMPVQVAFSCVVVSSFSWTVPGGGMVRGHDVFASGASVGGRRFVRVRIFDPNSTAPRWMLRNSFAVATYGGSNPCGAPSGVGEAFSWSAFRVAHLPA
jgi:hypothetical protein